MDLSTSFMGLALEHPFVAGASPLSDTVERARQLEDAGAAAIVLRSVFEEQLTMAEFGRIHGMDPHEPEFASRLSEFPDASDYRFSPSEYLEHIRQVKEAVAVPVLASLRSTAPDTWASSPSRPGWRGGGRCRYHCRGEGGSRGAPRALPVVYGGMMRP